MDEIKAKIEKAKYETGVTPTSYRFSKEQLMRLIGLIEEAQIENCAERVNRDMKEFVRESERVSKQLTENYY